jgi:transcriptional regulator of acetoin/glycerol metabolism
VAPAIERHVAAAAVRANGPSAGPATASALALLCTGDAQVAALVQKARRVLDRDIPMLLVGETGTGKRAWARALHADSRRAAQPFVAVDCTLIPPAQLEAELFGRDLPAAQGGTLFLDGVGELPLAAQAQLLRVLQEQHAQGGEAGTAPRDIALICATTRPLQERIDAGVFREDLYYRLDGLTLRLPPLRARSDVAALAARMLSALVARDARGRCVAPVLSPDASALLGRFHWPGNLRQLHNVLRSALALADGAAEIRREHLPDELLGETSGVSVAASVARRIPAASTAMPPRQPLRADPTIQRPAAPPLRSLVDLELEAIRRALEACGGNVSAAARQLGVGRNTIYRKLRAADDAAP